MACSDADYVRPLLERNSKLWPGMVEVKRDMSVTVMEQKSRKQETAPLTKGSNVKVLSVRADKQSMQVEVNYKAERVTGYRVGDSFDINSTQTLRGKVDVVGTATLSFADTDIVERTIAALNVPPAVTAKSDQKILLKPKGETKARAGAELAVVGEDVQDGRIEVLFGGQRGTISVEETDFEERLADLRRRQGQPVPAAAASAAPPAMAAAPQPAPAPPPAAERYATQLGDIRAASATDPIRAREQLAKLEAGLVPEDRTALGASLEELRGRIGRTASDVEEYSKIHRVLLDDFAEGGRQLAAFHAQHPDFPAQAAAADPVVRAASRLAASLDRIASLVATNAAAARQEIGSLVASLGPGEASLVDSRLARLREQVEKNSIIAPPLPAAPEPAPQPIAPAAAPGGPPAVGSPGLSPVWMGAGLFGLCVVAGAAWLFRSRIPPAVSSQPAPAAGGAGAFDEEPALEFPRAVAAHWDKTIPDTLPPPPITTATPSVDPDPVTFEAEGFAATVTHLADGQRVFGRYVLERLLGRGGMGVVWLARDEVLEQRVALKFLPEVLRLDAAAIDELKRETRRSLRLTHPNIVRIFDFVSDEAVAAIAMEYIDGPTLSALRVARPNKVFEVSGIADWIRQFCDALDYAHNDAGVIHRDLKPANLMLTSRSRVKVTDFGIARTISDSVSHVSMQPGTSGTLAFMSPQQAMGEPPAPTDDIYAVGGTIFQLLAGTPPFYSGDLLAQIREKVPSSMAERRRLFEIDGEPIPSEWEDVVASCLAKAPEHRPQSARELAQALGLR